MHPGLLQNGQELLECFLIIINKKDYHTLVFGKCFIFAVPKSRFKINFELEYENENPDGMLS